MLTGNHLADRDANMRLNNLTRHLPVRIRDMFWHIFLLTPYYLVPCKIINLHAVRLIILQNRISTDVPRPYPLMKRDKTAWLLFVIHNMVLWVNDHIAFAKHRRAYTPENIWQVYSPAYSGWDLSSFPLSNLADSGKDSFSDIITCPVFRGKYPEFVLSYEI